MQVSLDQFLRTIGPNNVFAVKEQYNIATAKYDSGRFEEALQDLQAVRPKLAKYIPQAEAQCDELIRRLQTGR